MRMKEPASRQNRQPLPAHLSVRKELRPLEKRVRITPGEAKLSSFAALFRLPRLPRRAVGPAVDSGDSGSPLTLPPRPGSLACKQSVSNPLAVNSFQMKASSGSKQSASDPLAGKPFAIKASSGLAAWRPFFVKLNHFAGVSEAGAGRRNPERRRGNGDATDVTRVLRHTQHVPGQ
jgi:hypothetical protein